MSGDFVKVDLHIHTPASKCYKGKKDDGEYLNILRKAKKEKLKIIAITDHNSIQGYKKLVELKNALINERKTLSAITDSDQSKKRLKEIETDLLLFEDILVLPGIEFETRPGIHLLVIFSSDTRIEIIDKFLMDGGYGPQNCGEEEPRILANWDIFNFFDECKKLNCLVIDAHTDSNKGIYNTIQKGATRTACFKSPQLNAVCYDNEIQIEKLKQILKTAKEYIRQVPLSFVKFSDAHSVNKIGSAFTWFRLENINFESLKVAFANSSEMISIEEPSLSRILNELCLRTDSFGVPDLSDSSKEDIKRYICSLHNSIGGNILIGVTDRKVVIGIRMEAEEAGKEIVKCFIDICGSFRYQITVYPLHGDRIVVSIRIAQGSYLINIEGDNRIHTIKDNKVEVLSALDVQMLIEDRLIDKMESKINKRLLAVENDCKLIKNLFSILPIVRKFEKNSISARFNVEIEKSRKLNIEDIQKLKKAPANGISKGNLFYLDEKRTPRLPYTYLRYSLPLFMLKNIEKKILNKETIYIVPGGGAYIAKRDYPFFSDNDICQRIIKLCKTRANARYGIKFTLCFLKSSLLLWYCLNKYESTDIYDPEIFNNLRLPGLNISDPSVKGKLSEINNHCNKIIDLERKYLSSTQKLKKAEIKEKINKIDQHNADIDKIAYDIDQVIYQLLNLNADEISIIENTLGLNEIYLPKNI
jgi:PHP family Zn ribbon phosphoesterase